MRLILTTSWLSIIISLNSFAQDIKDGNKTYKDYSANKPTVNENNIFRSKINNYRIKLPKGWMINPGNSIGVEFNAIDPLEIASMNIAVTHLDKSATFTAHNIPVDRIVASLKQSNKSYELIESKKIYLSNEKCLLIKTRMNYKTLEYDNNIITFQYNVIHKNLAITITYQVNEEFEKKYLDIIENSLLSFTFEDVINNK